MKKICLIVNPVAGRRILKRIGQAQRDLEKQGAQVDIKTTCGPGDATGLARQAVTQNYDVIVAAGGDGTVNEIMNGMAHSTVPMALLPFGTTNLFAREIGLHRRPGKAVDTIMNGRKQTVNLGRAGDRYFLLMAGIGFDAHVVYNLNLRLKSLAGELAYIFSALRVIAKTPPRKCIEARINGDTPIKCSSLILGNAKYYGGSFEVTPGATITKPSLQLCAFAGETRRSIVGYALGILMKKHTHFANVTTRTVECLDVVSENPVHVQVDGDYLRQLPLELKVVPEALTILRPTN